MYPPLARAGNYGLPYSYTETWMSVMDASLRSSIKGRQTSKIYRGAGRSTSGLPPENETADSNSNLRNGRCAYAIQPTTHLMWLTEFWSRGARIRDEISR